jgi:hypothetical protein
VSYRAAKRRRATADRAITMSSQSFPGRKRVTQGIRYEVRDNQFYVPTTFGIEHNRLGNCQMQFNTTCKEANHAEA